MLTGGLSVLPNMLLLRSCFFRLRLGNPTHHLFPLCRVGLTIGFIFGNFAILSCVHTPSCQNRSLLTLRVRATDSSGGAGRKGYLPTLSTYMLSSGATFAFFMSSTATPFAHLPPSRRATKRSLH
jgi:hypothetical protein